MASSASKDTEIDKILAVSEEKDLLEISLMSGSSRILLEHNYYPNSGCAFSPPIDNRFVYLVGTYNAELTSDVTYYDLSDPEREPFEAPSTISRRTCGCEPRLILLGTKLLAFPVYKMDSKFLFEVLDTASKPLQWLPLTSRPNLPFGGDDDLVAYFVISYATHFNNLFISLGNAETSFTMCYDDSKDLWTHPCETPLPFYDQGKFVDGLCYGFPKRDPYDFSYNFNYLACYKLAADWESNYPNVSCQELVKYSLSISPMRYQTCLHSFFASSSNVFTIVRAKESLDQNTLEVDVVQLLPPKRDSSPEPQLPHFNVCVSRPPLRHPYCEPKELYWPGVPPKTGDTQGSSRLLKHTSILLPLPLEEEQHAVSPELQGPHFLQTESPGAETPKFPIVSTLTASQRLNSSQFSVAFCGDRTDSMLTGEPQNVFLYTGLHHNQDENADTSSVHRGLQHNQGLPVMHVAKWLGMEVSPDYCAA
ncbi:hypothetical protein KSS87_004466 [Heliosperma pusillum]|nr:hypothetical protein KSS87_004466 [Heliosperma pusillum]